MDDIEKEVMTLEVAQFIFDKLGAIFFMAILAVEVGFYFLLPMWKEIRKERRKDKKEESP